ncbi:hypothetical protein HBI24_151510 [Parastagonospora nodorum]|nr:hypothetical protein HBI47_098070 [Parastagonospora nodorum]KAH5579838.1 hypothetical protein HBI24_151510 [Parastagonospora nodorum]
MSLVLTECSTACLHGTISRGSTALCVADDFECICSVKDLPSSFLGKSFAGECMVSSCDLRAQYSKTISHPLDQAYSS